jgi:SAM-dependent methyltransferase
VGSAIHEVAARGFARAPAAYERGRPGYPEEAVSYLLDVLRIRPGTRVLDLAAGTGKLTRQLAAAGADVTAVEPVAEMRAVLAAALPEVRVAAGAAEALPLADQSVDAVTVGQAFHWFRGDEALGEIHRVLRPRGRLGLVWNVKDESEPWVARLGRIIEPLRGAAPKQAAGAWRTAFEHTELFGPLHRRRFRLAHEVDREAVVERVASISFVAALPAAERERVFAEVRAMLAADLSTRGRERLIIPYRTGVYWCERS